MLLRLKIRSHPWTGRFLTGIHGNGRIPVRMHYGEGFFLHQVASGNPPVGKLSAFRKGGGSPLVRMYKVGLPSGYCSKDRRPDAQISKIKKHFIHLVILQKMDLMDRHILIVVNIQPLAFVIPPYLMELLEKQLVPRQREIKIGV